MVAGRIISSSSLPDPTQIHQRRVSFLRVPPLEKPVLHVFGRFLTSNIRYRTYGYLQVCFYAFIV
jgi:hypothetical protein